MIPRGGLKTDSQIELAVVIGREARYLHSPASAAEHIAGFCISNDVSERAFQLERGGQWVKGKSCDTLNPLGPWLAVIALMTFSGAYTAFLYPLLVARNQDMWLISVWLFLYQQHASSGGVFASVIITSLPTLAIFLFTQRTIMRGMSCRRRSRKFATVVFGREGSPAWLII